MMNKKKKKEAQKQELFSLSRIIKFDIRKKILVFCVFISITLLLTASAKGIFNKSVKIVSDIITQEQKRDFNKFEIIICKTQKNLISLEAQLSTLREVRKREITEEMQTNLLDTLSYLENDSLKIETSLMNYHTDISVQLHSQRDVIIDKKINSLWNTHIVINRLVRNVEDIAFSTKIVEGRLEMSIDTLREILKQFEKMENM